MLKVKRPFSCSAQPAERDCALSSSSSSSSSSAPGAYRGGPAWLDHTVAGNPLSLDGEIQEGEYNLNKRSTYECIYVFTSEVVTSLSGGCSVTLFK